MRAACLLALAVGLLASPASAELLEKTGRYGGLSLTYKVLLPPAYDAAKTYPAVLVFTGGPQQLRGAENTVNTDWRGEAEKRGYIVISPGTPNGSLFFEDADRVFPEFLDAILRDYKVRGGKLHVAGHSNGGLSAFHVAAKYPQYFLTVTGYPGLFQSDSDPGTGQRAEADVSLHARRRPGSVLGIGHAGTGRAPADAGLPYPVRGGEEPGAPPACA